METKPNPVCLSLFIQAVATRLTGEQLGFCLREVTHYVGMFEPPPLDARQQACVEAIVGDSTMAAVYDFELRSIALTKLRAERLQARCLALLQSFESQGRYSELTSRLSRLKDSTDHAVDNTIESLESFIAELKSCTEEKL